MTTESNGPDTGLRDDVIEHPDRRCLFHSKEETSVNSEVVNEYDDMEIVVCEDTRDIVVEARTTTAKLCQEHAEHCVESGKWEFVEGMTEESGNYMMEVNDVTV